MTKSNISKLVTTDSELDPMTFDWISQMQIDPEAVITNNKTSVVTWAQVVADAQAKGGDQLWLGPAAGGLDNVTAQMIWKTAGIQGKWVPFSSGGKAKAAPLVEQGITYTGNPGEIIGKPDFSIAAVCTAERLPQFPDVPTFKELGAEGLENEVIWRGFAVKAGTPDNIIAWYDDLFEKVGLFGSRLWVKITVIPKKVLLPAILAISIIGSFAVNYSFFDVASCIAFGIAGWIFRKYGFPVAPVVLGMVLGKLAEENFRRAVIMGGYNVFFTRPASLILLLLALLSFGVPMYQTYKGNKKKKAGS